LKVNNPAAEPRALKKYKLTACRDAYLFIVESFVTLLIPGMLILTGKFTPVANFLAAQAG